jgi:hypothetical protein
MFIRAAGVTRPHPADSAGVIADLRAPASTILFSFDPVVVWLIEPPLLRCSPGWAAFATASCWV